jgi:thymidylate synthase (FAD)
MSKPEYKALKRPSVASMDAILGYPFSVLDHGFVRVIDYMGNDAAVVQAARVSYGDGTKSVSDDEALTHYLLRHEHTTPFEMCEIKLHCKMPIFVARQWIRHRTASVNEYSQRYSLAPDEFYMPEAEQVMSQSTTNKQGRDGAVNVEEAYRWLDMLAATKGAAMRLYKDATDSDIARELARIGLPVSNYTEWYWKTNLHNLMRFLKLRCDPHAQYEIRVYANVIASIFKTWLPVSHAAWDNHINKAVKFSGKAIEALRLFMQTEPTGNQNQLRAILKVDAGIKGRELQEICDALGIKEAA